MALCAGVCGCLGLSPVSGIVFFAGIVSVLVELDRTPCPPTRTPLGHSIPAAAAWSLVICAIALGVHPEAARGAALASISAFSSHLAADAFTAEGIFLWPRALSPGDWLAPYPRRAVVEWGGRRYPVASAGTEGPPGPWSGWRALSLSRLADGSYVLNAALSAAGLAALVTAVAVS